LTPSIPSAQDYASEPVRYPLLVVVDIAAEAAAVTEQYRCSPGDLPGTSILIPISAR